MRALYVWQIFSVLSTAITTIAAAQPTSPPTITFDVEGRPPKYDGKPGGPHFFLWHDADGWHLHSRTAGKPHNFAGVVKVAGGRIYELKGIGGLEKKTDFGAINRLENTVTFKFKSRAPGDGFDFKVDGRATRLDFEITVDGYGRPESILIGANGKSPPSHRFSVPLTGQ